MCVYVVELAEVTVNTNGAEEKVIRKLKIWQ